MKVGDYVRTKNLGGSIEKILEIIPKEKTPNLIEIYVTDVSAKYSVTISENEIIKSSPNIIDLIELNDVVELFEEDGLDDDEITGYYEVIAITTNKKEIGVRTANGEIDFFPVENLRGIITCEQIKTMEYKCE